MLCRLHPTYIPYLKQSIKTVRFAKTYPGSVWYLCTQRSCHRSYHRLISATKICRICVMLARVVPLLDIQQFTLYRGPNDLYKALSYVDNFTSALKTEWDLQFFIALCVDIFTSILTKENWIISIKQFRCQVSRYAVKKLDLALENTQTGELMSAQRLELYLVLDNLLWTRHVSGCCPLRSITSQHRLETLFSVERKYLTACTSWKVLLYRQIWCECMRKKEHNSPRVKWWMPTTRNTSKPSKAFIAL